MSMIDLLALSTSEAWVEAPGTVLCMSMRRFNNSVFWSLAISPGSLSVTYFSTGRPLASSGLPKHSADVRDNMCSAASAACSIFLKLASDFRSICSQWIHRDHSSRNSCVREFPCLDLCLRSIPSVCTLSLRWLIGGRLIPL